MKHGGKSRGGDRRLDGDRRGHRGPLSARGGVAWCSPRATWRAWRRPGSARARRQRRADRTLAVACDVTVRAQIEALLAAAMERFGRVDVWVNNAGFGLIDSVERMDMAACRRMFDTNLFGAIECMQVVAPVLKRQRSGAIINVSSMAGTDQRAVYVRLRGDQARAELHWAARRGWSWLPTEFTSTRSAPVLCTPISAAMRCAEARACAWRAWQDVAVTAARVANAVWNAYRFNRREVVVPWSGHLVVGLYRLLPGSLQLGNAAGCCAGWISPRRVRLTDWRPGIPPDRRLESRRARGRGNSRPACPRSAAQSLAELRDPAPACPDHRWS